MADGDSARRAAQHARMMGERLGDPEPCLEVVAVQFAQMTDRAFETRTSPHGESWPELRPSTIARRAAKLKGARAKKRGKIERALGLPGKGLTRRAKAIRATAIASGSFTPLHDTGRARQSIAYTPLQGAIKISFVRYLLPHVVGSANGRPPKRNPLVMQLTADGDAALVPVAHSLLLRAHNQWVRTGHVEVAE